MNPLEPLAPDQRAVIALVLQQGRSYDEISSRLDIPVDAVRARARAGLAVLAPGNGLPGEITAPLADYLLGQQPAGDAEATRGLLAESSPAREWASGVAASLDGVAPDGLPEIPAPPRPVGASAVDDTAAPGAATATPVPGPRPRPVRAAPPATAGGDPPASRLGGGLLIAGVVVVVAVVLFLALRSSGDDRPQQPSASGTPAPTATPTATATPAAPAQVADRITLKGAGGSKASGRMTVLLQDGQLLFQLQATGVPESPANSAYAVWFTNPGGQAHRLGFTNPVGADGKLGIQGPSDKDRAGFPKLYATYRTVVVSRETSETAKRPTQVLLTGALPKGR